MYNSYHRRIISLVITLIVCVLFTYVFGLYGSSWIASQNRCGRITLWIVAAVWLTFALLWWIGKRLIFKRSITDNDLRKNDSHGSQNRIRAIPNGVIFWLLAISFSVKLIEVGTFLNNQTSQCVMQIGGVTILLVGFFFAVWGRIYLGQRWHRDVRVPDILIRNGPYKFVRHPIYAGEIFMAFGTALWSVNILVFAFLFGGMFIFNYLRCTQEEAALLNRFGAEYLLFMKKRGRFFPFTRYRKS